MKSLSAIPLLFLVLSFSAQAAIDADKVYANNLTNSKWQCKSDTPDLKAKADLVSFWPDGLFTLNEGTKSPTKIYKIEQNNVVLSFNNGYATWSGEFKDEEHIKGSAQNIKGFKWNFECSKITSQAAIYVDYVNELKKEIAAESGGSEKVKTTVIYGTVLGARNGEVHVREDKKSNGLITVHLIDVGMTNDDANKFPEGTRVKISVEEGGVIKSIVKVTGKEAQIKILNRSDCLQHYGTDGAVACLKKFPK